MQLTLTIHRAEPAGSDGSPADLCFGYEIEASGHDFQLTRRLDAPAPPDMVLRVALNLSEAIHAAVEAADGALAPAPAEPPVRSYAPPRPSVGELAKLDAAFASPEYSGPLSKALQDEIAAAQAAAKLGEV